VICWSPSATPGHPSSATAWAGGSDCSSPISSPSAPAGWRLSAAAGSAPGVTPLLRAATLPGSSAVVAGLARVPDRVTRLMLPAIAHLPGLVARHDAAPLAEGLVGLAGARQRRAFLLTAAAVLDWRGQTVSATRQLGLLADLPLLVAWGAEDRTIPPHHQRELARQLPCAWTAEIPDAGHHPQETAPGRLLAPLQEFLATTQPFRYSETRWRSLLTASSAA
jgi:pimeloyl-ACP methyl ester carboxylesterase